MSVLAQLSGTEAFSAGSSTLAPKHSPAIHTTNTHWSGKTARTIVSQSALPSTASAAAASTAAEGILSDLPHSAVASNLAVSLDRPLLSPIEFASRTPAHHRGSVWSSFLAVLLSDVFKTALVAFLLALGASLVPRLLVGRAAAAAGTTTASGAANDDAGTTMDRLSALASRLLAPVQNALTKKTGKREKEAYSAPMPFEGDGGWGKCTLRSKHAVGSFEVYDFALPESYYTVPLALGQTLEFCCLSRDDDICTGSLYPYCAANGNKAAAAAAGTVRVALPKDKEGDEGSSKFNEVLRTELRPGDEVAIKPGKSHLTYRGPSVPVTDVVYLAYGLGIVPVLDQVRATTPRGSSSVRVSSVVWFNDNGDDFDLAVDDLEKEYLKHPSKLAVSCIVVGGDDASKGGGLEGNAEAEEAVPYFDKGTMAVVAGPKRFAEKAKGYLMRKGYPENCICVLP
eukprot:CAMPEP_0181103914 /NCGR_PEP_ID=MMETSP1071-20121207/15138_1 /TAXON_ID=35127 /ORGANISM="Thalassiosira sp., Strain NH16" /LENGTH=454 /DNA_ID=CAMNT_0023187057 /DNA_START=462 /DNA_END=1826 /DNA_ORIENTATION=-